jgi:orotate phosphoribosyltransferase-like protein
MQKNIKKYHKTSNPDGLTKTQRKILSFEIKNANISNNDIAKELNLRYETVSRLRNTEEYKAELDKREKLRDKSAIDYFNAKTTKIMEIAIDIALKGNIPLLGKMVDKILANAQPKEDETENQNKPKTLEVKFV